MADITESMFVNGMNPVEGTFMGVDDKGESGWNGLQFWERRAVSSAFALCKTQRRESTKTEEMLIVTAAALASVELGLKILIAAASGFICAKAPQQ